MTSVDNHEAEGFHASAVSSLSSLCSDPSNLTDGTVLAATVILRLYEESKGESNLHVSHLVAAEKERLPARRNGEDTESHLLAGRVFAAMTHDPQRGETKLARAAFWIHQRQDVYHAISYQKPTRTRLDPGRLLESVESEDVHFWTRRSTLLAGQVADFCFGESRRSISAYHELERKLQDWWIAQPIAFRPLHYGVPDLDAGHVFPRILFALNSACESL